MKVLLINSNRFKQPFPVMPAGLCWVASALEGAGHEVTLLDLTFSAEDAADPVAEIRREIAECLARVRPGVIGIGIRNLDNSTGFNTRFLLGEVRLEVTDPVKELFDGPIVIGGSAVGINGSEMLEYLDMKYAIRGDGEEAMITLCARLENGQGLDGMPGLTVRSGGKILHDILTENSIPLDDLPPPRPHRFLDMEAYKRVDAPLTIQTKRGCALKCTYCIYNVIEGKTYRYRDPQLVADEIEMLYRETGIDRFEFTDSTFNVPLKHSKEVLRALIAKGLKLRLSAMGLNPRSVDEEFVDLLVRAGFMSVDLGVEAGNNTTLRTLGKNFNKTHVLQAGKYLHKAKIPITWHLLLGAPEETPETLAETFATLDKAVSPWDFVNIGVGMRVYKDSPMAQSLAHGGDPSVLSKDGFLTPVNYVPEGIDLDTIKILTRQAALSRPNYFLYDEDEDKVTQSALIRGTKFLSLFAPRQPVWRFYILGGMMANLSGLGLLRRLRHAYQHRHVLRRVAQGRRAVREQAMMGGAAAEWSANRAVKAPGAR